jgi:pilus assembly protein CpaC
MRLPGNTSKSLLWASGTAVALAWLCVSPSLGAAPGARSQQPPPLPATQQPTVTLTPAAADRRLLLVAGRSEVVTTEFNIERVSITNSEIADVVVVEPRQMLVNAKTPGTVSLWIWGTGRRMHYELVIDPGVTTLQQKLQQLFPGEDIQVSLTEGAMILSGRVSNNTVMIRAADIAQASAPDTRVINMLQLPGGEGSKQVMLQVRVAEVNRRALREIGISLFATRQGFTARGTTGQFPAPVFDDVGGGTGGLEFADFLNLFYFNRDQGIGGVMRLLEEGGWLESLAEPNLIAYNGQEASFLAGGEIPVPTVGGQGQVNVQWREFGVRLQFTPTIAGDFIRLHVRPEVSALDFANGVTISGFRIPALTSRWAETEVELRDGQSFAIAGLLNTVNQEDAANVPYLSKIPIIGNIFKSKANREERTELMVLITPRLVRPLNPDEVPPLPSVIKPPGGSGRGGGAGSGSGGEVAPQLRGGAGIIDAPGGRGRY